MDLQVVQHRMFIIQWLVKQGHKHQAVQPQQWILIVLNQMVLLEALDMVEQEVKMLLLLAGEAEEAEAEATSVDLEVADAVMVFSQAVEGHHLSLDMLE